MPSLIHVSAGQLVKETHSALSFMKREPGGEQSFSAGGGEEVCVCALLTYCILKSMQSGKGEGAGAFKPPHFGICAQKQKSKKQKQNLMKS